jgi:hypothetical protein
LRTSSGNLESAAIDALVEVLIPLARSLIRGEFGAGELVRAAKLSFVKAAVSEVVPFGERPNISRLSVVTGLTRKEVSALLGKQPRARKTGPKKYAMEQRAFRVIRGWRVDSRFQSTDGKPARLAIRGKRGSFAHLVRTYAGDVTPISVLKELERMQLVSRTREGKLQIRSERMRGRLRASDQFIELVRILSDFASTVSPPTVSTESPVFFGFRESMVSSEERAALFHRTFSRRAATILESIEQWLKHQSGANSRRSKARSKSIRVGLGVYLVNDASRKRFRQGPKQKPSSTHPSTPSAKSSPRSTSAGRA